MSVQRLRVRYLGWGEDWPLGDLALVSNRLLFEFSPQALARGLQVSPLRAPLPAPGSQALAVRGPATGQGMPGFLADALPDGWGMLLMDRALRKVGRDPAAVTMLERLGVVGQSAVGALGFEPVQPLPGYLEASVSLRALSHDMNAVLADAALRTPIEQLQRLISIGGSPQGARPKALLRWQGQRWSGRNEPAEGEPWLVKFPAQGEHAEVCALEHLYAHWARAGGLDMPVTRHIALSPRQAAFAVKRFDRVQREGAEVRVPLLSLAGALDADFRLPSLDYVTYLRATARITADYRETLKAFERCVVNVLAHNRDDHAKNFAFAMDAQGNWRLSPHFDFSFSQGPGGEHCTSVAGEGRRPARADLLRVAQDGGVKLRDAERCIAHWSGHCATLPDLLQHRAVRATTRKAVLQVLEPIWRGVAAD